VAQPRLGCLLCLVVSFMCFSKHLSMVVKRPAIALFSAAQHCICPNSGVNYMTNLLREPAVVDAGGRRRPHHSAKHAMKTNPATKHDVHDRETVLAVTVAVAIAVAAPPHGLQIRTLVDVDVHIVVANLKGPARRWGPESRMAWAWLWGGASAWARRRVPAWAGC